MSLSLTTIAPYPSMFQLWGMVFPFPKGMSDWHRCEKSGLRNTLDNPCLKLHGSQGCANLLVVWLTPVSTTFLLGSILMWLGLRTTAIFAIFAASLKPQL